MNFLLSALLVVLLLSPGPIFRIGYLNVRHGARSFKTSFIEEMIFSIGLTCIAHYFAIRFVNRFISTIDTKHLYSVLINSDKIINEIHPNHVFQFLEYLLSLYCIAYFSGRIVRYFSNLLNLDINLPIFRLYNEWYYSLRGFYADGGDTTRWQRFRNWFYRGDNSWKVFVRCNEVWLDVLVSTKNENIIYTGKLEDFVLSKETGLDRIFLTDVRRRYLNDDANQNVPGKIESEEGKSLDLSEEDLVIDLDSINDNDDDNDDTRIKSINDVIDQRYYKMPGHSFMIPYSQITNINIEYILLISESEE